MAITTITDVTSERICLNPGSADARCVLGTLGENAYPGQVVEKDESVGKWLLADSDHTTPGSKMMRIGIVGYEKRVNQSTMALKAITDVWTYNSVSDYIVPIWISGICVAYVVDINCDLPPGGDLMISGTAGSFTIMAATTSAVTGTQTQTTGSAIMQTAVASAAARIADGDTICIVGIGRCYGDIWGGINMTGS